MSRLVDLFAGTGAFTSAFNVKTVFANDFSDKSKQLYDVNFSHKLTLKDLNDIDVNEIPSHDILTGGFPCQPFSIAGKKEGFRDPRSNVFWKILEIIEKHSPKIVLLENVKNLLTHDSKKTFKIIKESLESKGYTVNYKVLNASEITGIPQHRERIYILCTKGETFDLDFPEVPKRRITEFLEHDIPEKYYYTEKSKIWNVLKESIIKKGVVYQYRRTYVRENKSGLCPTLTANMGTGGHNVPIILDDKGVRKLTPRECFNLQGFPQTYILPKGMSDSALYSLAGNAVCVPVVKLIADKINFQ